MDGLDDLLSQRKSTFQVTQNTSTLRKSSPTQLTDEGVLDLPRRSAQRRQLETLIGAAEVNGGSVENRTPTLDGMFSTICKYGKIGDIAKLCFLVTKDEKGHCCQNKNAMYRVYGNNIRSLSLLYAGGGGVISKVKYQQTRSSLVMKNTGRQTNQRLLRATSWYELFAPLSNLQSGVFCKVYTFVRRPHVPEKLLCL